MAAKWSRLALRADGCPHSSDRQLRRDGRRGGHPERRRAPHVRPQGAHGRLAADGHADLDARLPRVPAALLRLRAGLLLAARPAADDVRRLLPRLHGLRAAAQRRAVQRAAAAGRDHALPVLRGGDGRRRHGRAQPREPRAQDPLPAHRDPAQRRGHGGADAGRQHGRRRRLRDRRAGPAAGQLARRDPDGGDGLRVGDRAVDAAVGAVRALPRRAADLGGHPPGELLRDADPVPDRGRQAGVGASG